MRRLFLLALFSVVFAPATTLAAPVTTTFGYSFVGPGATINPGAFSPNAVSPLPTPVVITNPTFTAFAGPVNATVGSVTRPTNAEVVQTSGGLGVRTDGFSRVFGVTVSGPLQNETAGLLGGAVVDGVGSAISGTNGTTSELLTLKYTETDPNVINSRLTSVIFDNTLNFGPGNDFSILLNGSSIGSFNLPGVLGSNTFTLPSPLALNNGDEITFVPLTSSGAFNFFSVSGMQVQAEVIPEPTTLAIVGGIALAGLAGYRRRKVVPVA